MVEFAGELLSVTRTVSRLNSLNTASTVDDFLPETYDALFAAPENVIFQREGWVSGSAPCPAA